MLVRSLLESYELQVYTRDELSVQSNPLYANAIGGIKLYVHKAHADDAIAALKAHNYTPEEPEEDGEAQPWLIKLNAQTSRIPIIGNLSFLPRIVVLSGVCITCLSVALFFIFKPGLSKQLRSHEWCMDSVLYEGELYTLNLFTIRTNTFGSFLGACGTTCVFTDDYEIEIRDGSDVFESGKWKIEHEQVIIYACTVNKEVFEGAYTIQKEGRDWSLTSPTTQLFIWHTDAPGFYD